VLRSSHHEQPQTAVMRYRTLPSRLVAGESTTTLTTGTKVANMATSTLVRTSIRSGGLREDSEYYRDVRPRVYVFVSPAGPIAVVTIQRG
jgi:hypothetical protein